MLKIHMVHPIVSLVIGKSDYFFLNAFLVYRASLHNTIETFYRIVIWYHFTSILLLTLWKCIEIFWKIEEKKNQLQDHKMNSKTRN